MRPLLEENELTMPVPTEQRETPSSIRALQDYTITIEFLSRGCIVSVGCKRIPFESVGKAMDELNEYVKNPYETQLKWRNLLDN